MAVKIISFLLLASGILITYWIVRPDRGANDYDQDRGRDSGLDVLSTKLREDAPRSPGCNDCTDVCESVWLARVDREDTRW